MNIFEEELIKAMKAIQMELKVIRTLFSKPLDRIAAALELINGRFTFANNLEKQEDLTKAVKKEMKAQIEEITEIEEIFMDLTNVTVIFTTNAAALVSKQGFQKWIAFSLMVNIDTSEIKPGQYYENIEIKSDKTKWFNEKKKWDLLELRKQ